MSNRIIYQAKQKALHEIKQQVVSAAEKLRERWAEKFVNEFDYAASHIEAVNVFWTETLEAIINDTREIDCIRKETNEVHVFGFHNPRTGRPSFTNPETGLVEPLLPYQARIRNMSYTAPVFIDISYTRFVYKEQDEKKEKSEKDEEEEQNDMIRKNFPAEMEPIIQSYRKRYGRLLGGELHRKQILAELPVALWSWVCNLFNGATAGCCPGANDLAGLYVCNGTNRVISPPSRWCWNHDFVFRRGKKKFAAEAEVRSCHDTRTHRSTATLKLHYTGPNPKIPMNGRQILVSIPFLAKKIPLAVVFLALGWSLSSIRYAIRTAAGKQWFPDFNSMTQALLLSCKIKTEDDALLVVANSSKKTKPFVNNKNQIPVVGAVSNADKEKERGEQIKYAKDTLNRELLPHVGLSSEFNLDKGLYLGALVWKLFMCATNRLQPDDRDDYGYKRFDSAGVLMGNLFRQVLGVYMRQRKQAIVKQFDKEDRASKEEQQKTKPVAAAPTQTFQDVRGEGEAEAEGIATHNPFTQQPQQMEKEKDKDKAESKKKKKPVSVAQVFTDSQITMRFAACFGTGKWTASKGSYVRTGVARCPSHVNRVAAVCEISRLSSTLKPDGKHVNARLISASQYGRVCPTETPEGRPCGLVMYTAIGARLSSGSSPRLLIELIEHRAESLGFLPLKKWGDLLREGGQLHRFDNFCKLRIEGIPLGWLTVDPNIFVSWLRHLRRTSSIDGDVSVYHDTFTNEVIVRLDAGRVMRPLFLVSKLARLKALTPKEWTILSLAQLTAEGCIEMLDALETKSIAIAFDYADLIQRQQAAKDRGSTLQIEYMELDGSFQFGLSTSLIPNAPFNQSPRNTYQCAMGKQALSSDPECSSLHRSRHELYYPQRPLVSTKTGKIDNYCYQSSGVNAILAMLSEALNQEDALLIRKCFADRGGLLSASCRLYKEHQRKFGSSSNRETFAKPDPRTCGGIKDANYDKVQASTGIPLVNTQIFPGDIVIAKTAPVRQLTSQKEAKQTREAREALDKAQGIRAPPPIAQISRRDCAVGHKGEPGIVTEAIDTCNASGLHIRKVEVTAPRFPEIGDKFSSRHGQKGTCSTLVYDEDMIYTAEGMMPDIVVNPNCLVSRMTVAQQVESLFGKASAVSGVDLSDCTAFKKPDIKYAEEILKAHGFSPTGMEVFYHPVTGKKLEAQIFTGLVWYQRLRHMVADKMHARGASGPMETLTRQPLEGRGRDGGQRLGEMEREALVSHGVSNALLERLLHFSDPWKAHICGSCGFAGMVHARTKQPWCTYCKTGQHIRVVTTGYAWSLLVSELRAMGIRLKFSLQDCDSQSFFSPQLALCKEGQAINNHNDL